MPYSRIYELLDSGSSLVWPGRSAQEALFDLGERKRWTSEDRADAIEACSSWLLELGVEITAISPSKPLSWPEIRESLSVQDETDSLSSDGVAKDLHVLGELVSPAAKTLANNLGGKWFRPARADHRWLLCLGRTLITGQKYEGYLFHRRSFRHINEALAQCYSHMKAEQLDTADVMLLFSLIALWQRRRPTEKVKSNRKQSKPRRTTAKPIVGRAGDLLERGCLRPNVNFAVRRNSPALLSLVIELALTEAHLVPHPRRSSGNSLYSGWLESVLEQLERPEIQTLLGKEWAPFQYRTDTMRSYREKIPFPSPPESLVDVPFANSIWNLNLCHQGAKRNGDIAGSVEVLRSLSELNDWDGKAMHISQIRSCLEKYQ